MNCIETQERLSAFIDNELSDAEHHDVLIHLETCPACAASVEFAETLSQEARQLADPVPPADLWASIESALQDEPTPTLHPVYKWTKRLALPTRSWSLAASILILAAAGMWASHGLWGEHRHESMAADFDVYLAKFAVDPVQANETLFATYDGQPITVEAAEKHLGYVPLASHRAPAGFSVEQTFALDMPCCRCSLSVCRRSDGSVMTVLEHLDPQPIWFGKRSRIECLCDGKPTSVVQFDGQLAASWRQDKRHITIIGARDLEEVTQMVANFKAPTNG
ncbi:zf-HC2 domain-containing protein [Pirellulales bacterium]|nr:zf-HC2 domain-containing protein [Pirellulales bacterium]